MVDHLFYLLPLVWITAWDTLPKLGEMWYPTLLAWVEGIGPEMDTKSQANQSEFFLGNF